MKHFKGRKITTRVIDIQHAELAKQLLVQPGSQFRKV